MAHPIGKTAGKVWKFLDEKGEVTLNQMKKRMKAAPHLIPQAIGWLARADKFFDKASFRASKKEREFLVLLGA